MHIFLQGPIHIGKSTIIRKTITLLSKTKPLSLAGFYTYRGENGDPFVYIIDAQPSPASEAFPVAKMNDHGMGAIYQDVFDEKGVQFLKKVDSADLICMDELGFLESESLLFQEQVFHCLNGNTPILGVLRDREIPWHKPIKTHPEVSILRVNEENRNDLPERIRTLFGWPLLA